jgi:hypothetical protein
MIAGKLTNDHALAVEGLEKLVLAFDNDDCPV